MSSETIQAFYMKVKMELLWAFARHLRGSISFQSSEADARTSPITELGYPMRKIQSLCQPDTKLVRHSEMVWVGLPCVKLP